MNHNVDWWYHARKTCHFASIYPSKSHLFQHRCKPRHHFFDTDRRRAYLTCTIGIFELSIFELQKQMSHILKIHFMLAYIMMLTFSKHSVV